ncbi:phage tail protein [Pseudomonas nitroreducens]|uniref:phage tail protein n=1 Tax=Pseudomonas nitroreducens TaxID=46680 RepID=UPI00265A23EE|nr:phage tail protein [Pseudomonas nitroreducens]MCP1652733.1 putative phage tail protein [Pseudomonas nitroreducens]
MTAFRPIRGAKGGASKPRPSKEAPDSLVSLAKTKILDIIGEGEIVGLANGLSSVYLDETPVQAPSGEMNFNGVTVDVRTGSQDQEHIAGFPSVENETAVNLELRQGTPWVRQLTNTDLSAVRIRLSVPRLSKTDKTSGDVNGYRVEYAIDLLVDAGAWVEVLKTAFDGKCSTLYERTHRIELPAARQGWQVRVRRITANATDSVTADSTRIEAFTEVIDAKLRYPGTALVGVQYDAAQFSSNPTRAYDVFGRVIRVPSNYDPQSRAYVGIWDGTFKQAWSDNPAWVYLDLLTHFRYGLGHLITLAHIDRWALYRIAQYCDQLVPDGKGGMEPRFTVFLPLTKAADALRVLQDLSSVFRGMTCWGGGIVTVTADMPDDPVYTYTNGSVIDGKFSYAGTAKKTRATVAYVTWNDPSDFYRQKVEYVPDTAGIARYGIQEVSFTATGCKSQGQAQRAGKWALLTNRLETETVHFTVGLEGTLSRPGQVVRVADARRAGRRIGGRIREATRSAVLLDAAAEIAAGDTLIILLPTGVSQERTVKAVAAEAGSIRVTVTQDYDEAPAAQSVWAVESATLKTQLFRVVSVEDKSSDKEIAFAITALKHNPSKHAAVDHGAKIEAPPITVIPPSVQAAPKDVALSVRTLVDQGISVSVMEITCAAPANAIAYEFEWRRNNGEWVYAGRSGAPRMEVIGVYAGRYVARVRAVNALDIASVPALSAETELGGKTTPPPVVAYLKTTPKVFGIGLEWAFPEGVSTADTQRTEIVFSTTTQRADAQPLGSFAYPQSTHDMQGLAAGVQFFFWARLVDRTGNAGEWYPAGIGITGQSSSDASEVLGYLAGKIGETELAKNLGDRINLIDGPASLAGSVAAKVAGEASARQQALTAEASARAAAIGVESTNRQNALLAEASARGTAISQEATARSNADTALGQRIDTVTATTGQNTAAISQEATARTTADAALGKRIDTVVAATDANAAAITAEQQARADGDGANATAITKLTSQIGSALNKPYASDFTDPSAEWVQVQASAATIAASQAAGNTRGSTMRAVGTDAHWWGESKKRVKFDPARLYRVTCRIQMVAQPTKNPTIYAGLYCYAGDGATRISTGSVPGHYVLATSVYLKPGIWTTFTAYVRGHTIGDELGNSGAGTEADPKRLKTGTVFMSPMLIMGYNAIGGTFEVDYFDIEDVTELRVQLDLQANALQVIDTRVTATDDRVTVEAQRLDSLTASLTVPMAGDSSASAGTTQVKAGVWSEQSARVEADLALASRVDGLTTSLGSANAGITREQQARTEADSALSSQLDILSASLGDTAAAVSTEQTARATADTALGQRIDTVTVTADAAKAGVQTEQTARANADTALGQRIDTVTATAGTAQATAQQSMTAVTDLQGKVSASYSVKLQVTQDGRYYAAGMGIGIENTPSGMQTQVLFQADRFAVINTANGQTSTPFVIQNGQVFMNSAFIGAGTIDMAKIATALQSTDYIPGQRGWRLTQAGQFELNSTIAGQGRLVMTNQRIEVYDVNNVLRVRLGLW